MCHRWLDSCLYVIFKFKCALRKGRLETEKPLKKETFSDILQNQIFIHFTEIFSAKELFNYKNKVQSMNSQNTFSRQFIFKVHSNCQS